jgi:hydrogenase maturation factor
MDFLCLCLDIWPHGRDKVAPEILDQIRDMEIRMADLVDLAIPANAQAVAEALGLKVHRSVTSGARVRQIPREEAEIALECLRDWGISARILEDMPDGPRP